MAVYMSDAIGADGTGDTAVEIGRRFNPGRFGSSLKIARAAVTVDSADGDVFRFFTLPSGARIWHVYFACTDSGTTGVIDIGLHKAGTAHDGAVIDDDLFATAVVTTTAAPGVVRVDVLLESTTLVEADRGKYLWQLADAGAGTYTTDPFEDWDFTGTMDTGGDASATYTLEVQYV